jgi:hypothetical protein
MVEKAVALSRKAVTLTSNDQLLLTAMKMIGHIGCVSLGWVLRSKNTRRYLEIFHHLKK